MNASTTQRAATLPRLLALIAAVGLACALLAFGITEEIPLGGLSGKAVMKENGNPLDAALIHIAPTEDNDNEATRAHAVETDKEGRFNLRNLPAGDYTVWAYTKAHRLESQKITVAEGKPTVIELSLAPQDPYLNLNTSQKVFLPSEEPSFQMDGFFPEDEVSIDIYKLDLSQLVQRGSVDALLRSFYRYEANSGDPSKVGKVVSHMDHKITSRDSEGVFVETLALKPLAEGFYWVRCRAGKVDRGGYLNVSKIGLVTKSGSKNATCFVTDLKTGIPIEGAKVSVAVNSAMKPMGATKQDGSLDIALPKAERQLVMAQQGSSVAVADFYGNSGGGDEDEDGDGGGAKNGRIFLYSDRPIYRPGDTVQFKGIARQLNGVDFVVPKGGSIKGELRDPDDNLMQNFDLKLTGKGTFSGKFTTNKEAKPGGYTLLVNGPGGQGRLYISLAAYRKPEFKITVTPEKKFFVFGEKAKMRVKCEYYFGGPVVGAKLSAYISRSPYYAWEDEDGEEYVDESGSGETVDDFTDLVTDENGECEITFDTERPEASEDDSDYFYEADYNYKVDVTASEAGDKYFDGQGSVKVTRGAFETDVQAQDYFGSVGTPVEIDIKAQTHDTKKPLAGKQFQLVVGQEVWDGKHSTFHPLDTMSATTGADGVATVTYTPKKSGPLMFKATAKDDMGNEIVSNDYYYVEGDGVPARPGGKLTVEMDKTKYEIGDTSRVLIQTDKPGGFALLTVEADEVLYEKVVNLTQSVTTVSFPVEKAYAPNARVAVAYIRDKQFYEASDDLVIDLVQQKLKIAVKPDKDKLEPGQTVNYAITTTDMDGKPVAADLSLGVVDESIYALAADDTNPLKGFFPRRNVSVTTTYSFPEIYLDGGDKAGGSIPIRSKFQDTAFWNPNVHTDAGGHTSVSVTLPDNLTTWRATVVGVTDTTAVGMQTATVRASKPLMIRLETPMFMVAQDEQKVVAVVQNDTGQAADVTVRLRASGVTVDGDANPTVRVEPGEPKAVEWHVTATKTGTAELTATAEISGGANDGVKHTIEVKPHGREFQEIKSDVVKGDASFDMMVRGGADPNTGRLVLNLSPSIATTLVQSLDSLVKYPYGCVEQTMSRFLPAILVDKALTETGLSRPDLHKKVPGIAADGLARLQKMQHGDGGWGWWEFDESDPFMTALVLDGLARAKQAGYKVNESMLARGLEWAQKRFDSEQKKTDLRRDLVYLCFALAENGKVAEARKVFNFEFKDAGSPDLALGALTANLLGPDFASKRDTMLSQLRARANVSGNIAKWPEELYSWGVEPTALALAALVKLAPNDELIPKTVRYLMVTRQGEYWYSTRDTAYVLIGMTSYLHQTKELAGAGGSFTVYLNGKELRKVSFNKASLLQPDLQITVPMPQLQQGKNTIRIAQTGGSVCYYSADLKQVVPDSQLGAIVNGSGLTVERKYYRMEARRMEDGSLQLKPSEKPVDEVRSGDVIKCVLTVTSSKDRQFVMVEDPVPSNCRVTERDEPYEDESWGWWWARTVILDDRVSFFARELPAGMKEFSYIMRAEADGLSKALPTRVGNMYDPDDVASSGELQIKVNPR